MRSSLTFVSNEAVEATAAFVAEALGLTFRLHDSLYLGGNYYRAEQPEETVLVHRNEDLGEPSVEGVPDPTTVVPVDPTPRADAVIEALTGDIVRLVERREW